MQMIKKDLKNLTKVLSLLLLIKYLLFCLDGSSFKFRDKVPIMKKEIWAKPRGPFSFMVVFKVNSWPLLFAKTRPSVVKESGFANCAISSWAKIWRRQRDLAQTGFRLWRPLWPGIYFNIGLGGGHFTFEPILLRSSCLNKQRWGVMGFDFHFN